MDIKKLVKEPIFFDRNRVYRIYLGGKQYTKIFEHDGYDDGTDNFFPEEWIASKVKAINPRYFGKRDGVSVVKGTEIFFDDLLRDHPEELLGGRKYDCLVKFLDSAIRLPFQVHPFRASISIPNTEKRKRGSSWKRAKTPNSISGLKTR